MMRMVWVQQARNVMINTRRECNAYGQGDNVPSIAGNVGLGAQERAKVRSWMEDRGLSGDALTK